MTRTITALKFIFHNGGEWEVPVDLIGDMWIKRVSTSIGRIRGGEIVEIHPAQAFRIEILPNADTVKVDDINKGALEVGIFETIVKNNDIELLRITWDNQDEEEIYFPFETADESGTENKFMTAKIIDKKLYIVIDENNTVEDIYK
ncbi:hypothetical protein ACF3NG_05895 [Aerococcaceae bacterium WGS1372]